MLFGKRQHAASRVADKGTGFSMQFEYRRPESNMPITEQNIAVSFARCLPFVLITTCHSLVTRLSIIATACQTTVSVIGWVQISSAITGTNTNTNTNTNIFISRHTYIDIQRAK